MMKKKKRISHNNEYYIGRKYNNWLVEKYIETVKKTKPNGSVIWSYRLFQCRCLKCNKSYIQQLSNVVGSQSKQCGSCAKSSKGGISQTPIYRIWYRMMERCYNKDDYQYEATGKLGIKVCKRWHNYKNFMKDVSYHKNLEFSRIDNTKDYSPNNCKWMSHSEVMLNRRYTYGLCTKALARLTGYSSERLNQLNGKRKDKYTKNILKPFVIKEIKTKMRSRFIYKPEAIEFLLRRRENKSK
jgi:hypothetical protein